MKDNFRAHICAADGGGNLRRRKGSKIVYHLIAIQGNHGISRCGTHCI